MNTKSRQKNILFINGFGIVPNLFCVEWKIWFLYE